MDHSKILANLKPGCVATLRSDSSIVIGDDDKDETPLQRQTLLVGKLKEKTAEKNDIDVIKLCLKITNSLTGVSCGEAMIQPPEADDLIRMRKAIKYTLDGIVLKLEVCSQSAFKTQNNETQKKPAQDITKGPKSTVRRADVRVLKIRTKDRSFADAVKDLKTHVQAEDDAVVLEKISVTRKGDIRIQIREKKTGGKSAFGKTLAEKAK